MQTILCTERITSNVVYTQRSLGMLMKMKYEIKKLRNSIYCFVFKFNVGDEECEYDGPVLQLQLHHLQRDGHRRSFCFGFEL